MNDHVPTYRVNLTADEMLALEQATYAVPTTGYGPSDSTMPILRARRKLEVADA